jgi:exodeoxyribonuclease VII small subunit
MVRAGALDAGAGGEERGHEERGGEALGGEGLGREERAPAPAAGVGAREPQPAAGAPRLEEALAQLEAIAGRLEKGTLPLEEALALYREARGLHARCVALLSEAERELQVLMPGGELRPEPAAGLGGDERQS